MVRILVVITQLVVLGSIGCGLRPGGCAFNDPAPNGTLIKQGPFTSLNGKTVSGTATIYRLASDGSYAIRLEGVSIPNEAGLQVTGTATPAVGASAVAYQATVRGYCGTQNYYTSVTDTRTWSKVAIFSPAANVDYGAALLQ